jgi:hypothetical protein
LARTFAAITAGLFALSGCANLPNVAVTYYPPIAHVTVTATQSLDCNKSNTRVFASTTVKAVSTWTPDRTQPRTLHIAELDGAFSDTSLSFTLTEDGRLKGINVQTTGEAAAVISSGITLGTALATVAAQAHGRPTVCNVIADWGKGKPVTVVWRAELASPPNLVPGNIPFSPSPESQDVANALVGYSLPQMELALRIDRVAEMVPPVVDLGSSDVAELDLNKTAQVDISVLENQNAVWAQAFILPIAGRYTVPVPKSKLFGADTFTLALSDAGAVTSVTYNKTAGIGAALGAAGSVATAAAPPPASSPASSASSAP